MEENSKRFPIQTVYGDRAEWKFHLNVEYTSTGVCFVFYRGISRRNILYKMAVCTFYCNFFFTLRKNH